MALSGASLLPWGRIVGKAAKAAGLGKVATVLGEDASPVSKVFGGANDPGANLKALERAQAMERSPVPGMSDKEHLAKMWQETGWNPGPEGNKWLYEIPDQGVMLKRPGLKVDQQQSWEGPLSDVIHHPELFKRQPDLADLHVTASMSPYTEAGGYFQSLRGKKIDANASNPQELIDTLLHEVNHASQHFNAFEGGTNAEAIGRALRREQMITGELPSFSDAHLAHQLYLHKMGEAMSRGTEFRYHQSPESNLLTPPSQTLETMGYPYSKLLTNPDIEDITKGARVWTPPPQKKLDVGPEVIDALRRRLDAMGD
jgi:hypothetical protein